MNVESTKNSPLKKVSVQEKQEIDLFIRKSKKMRKKLKDGLIRSAYAEDQGPMRNLRSAIYSINNTIAALQQGTKKLADIKKFHLHIFLPFENSDPEIEIKIEILQRKQSNPLPPGYFLEIQPPRIESARTAIIKSRKTGLLKYEHTFNFGERNIYTVNDLLKGDFEFKLYQRSTILGEIRNILKAVATVPIGPLSYSTNVTAALRFQFLDGHQSPYIFDARLIENSPLAAPEDLNIDENIYVFEIVNEENDIV